MSGTGGTERGGGSVLHLVWEESGLQFWAGSGLPLERCVEGCGSVVALHSQKGTAHWTGLYCRVTRSYYILYHHSRGRTERDRAD